MRNYMDGLVKFLSKRIPRKSRVFLYGYSESSSAPLNTYTSREVRGCPLKLRLLI